jgi:hypothetical protein
MTIHYKRSDGNEVYSVTQEEDDDEDALLNTCDICSDCEEPDTGYCACVYAEDYASDLGISVEEWQAERRLEARTYNSQRALRQSIRRARKHIIAWRCVVRVHMLISFWRRAAAAPDSKAFQRAAKRFRVMAEGR